MRIFPTLTFLTLLAGCDDGEKTDDSGQPAPQPEADCGDGIDNDEDAAIDCADSDCADDPACQEDTGQPAELEGDQAGECEDGADNDGDGATDCADSGCADDPACQEDTGQPSTNQAPTAPQVELSPSDASTSDDLACQITAESTDPDGDELAYRYAWIVDGVELASGSETSWEAARTAKGQTIQCQAWATDGLADSERGSSKEVVVRNSAPSLADAAISPQQATAEQSLSCAWSGFEDADLDDDLSTVSWTVEGTELGSSAELASGYVRGDEVVCAVIAHDGQDAGNTVSDSIVIENSPPELLSVWLTPADADILSTLSCTMGSTRDADGDTVVAASYGWTVDGVALPLGDATLDPQYFDEGDLVGCSVAPSDGFDLGAAVSSDEVEILAGPVLGVDISSHDFGQVEAGCGDSVDVTILNTGTADLLVSAASQSGDGEFSHDLPLPSVVPAGDSVVFAISFAPEEEALFLGDLEISSNDPRGSASISFTGEGAWASHSESFTAEGEDIVFDLLFAVDKSASMGTDIANLVAAAPDFFDELLDAGCDFQVAAVVTDDGCIHGDDIWIDDSFSDSEAADALQTMLSGAAGSNTERAFTLLEAALSNNGTGDCNEDLVRDEADLHLVGVSDEPEQSVNSYSYYVSLFQSYKDSSDMVVIHGIGGDYPSGCSGSSAYTGVYEASVATGGAFLSICDDMATNLAGLAAALTQDRSDHVFALAAEPTDETVISVTVEGADISGSWTWDAADNTVTVDAGAAGDGESVTLEFTGLATSCEEGS